MDVCMYMYMYMLVEEAMMIFRSHRQKYLALPWECKLPIFVLLLRKAMKKMMMISMAPPPATLVAATTTAAPTSLLLLPSGETRSSNHRCYHQKTCSLQTKSHAISSLTTDSHGLPSQKSNHFHPWRIHRQYQRSSNRFMCNSGDESSSSNNDDSESSSSSSSSNSSLTVSSVPLNNSSNRFYFDPNCLSWEVFIMVDNGPSLILYTRR